MYEFQFDLEEHELAPHGAWLGTVDAIAVIHVDRHRDWYVADWLTKALPGIESQRLLDLSRRYPFWKAYLPLLVEIEQEGSFRRAVTDAVADRADDITEALSAHEAEDVF